MVLWSIWTTPSWATGETPFFLVYGVEAVLPSELTFKSPRTSQYAESEQDDRRVDDVNFIEELRCWAALRAARYQQSLHRYHERKVKGQSLAVGDLVLCRILMRAGLNKLSLGWEGPYTIVAVPSLGCVRLAQDGQELPNPWNVEHLRKLYP